MDLRKLTACQVAEVVTSGEITAYQLIEETLERCKVVNDKLNTFMHIADNEALEQAAVVDKMVKTGLKLPLAGVPVAVKDDLCSSALPTTFGSPAFKNFRSPYSAAVVDKLLDAGAVVLGKTNLDDLSMGSTAATSYIGPALNPWIADRVAGSAGAAAVAAGQCLIAIGSDSSGALRQGASHCGVFGLRPTMGRVSRYGLSMASSSFGQVGVTAASTEDILIALEVISGSDIRDASTTVYRENSAEGSHKQVPTEIKIGYSSSYLDLLDLDHQIIQDQAMKKVKSDGYQLVDLRLDLLAEGLRAYYVIAMAEASSNHSRYDGIRFGVAADVENLDQLYSKSRSLTFGREARRRSIFGTFILNHGSYDRYYRQALKVWNLVRRGFETALDQCDLLLLPVVRNLPHAAAEQVEFLRLYEEDIFCAPVSMTGLPALTLPAGELNQIPVGMQLVGRPFSEKLLLSTAYRLTPEIRLPPNGIY